MDNCLAFVVEDDGSLAEAYAEVLRLSGFEVEVLRSGKTAQERLKEAVPGVVVLDLHLPVVAGDALLAQIRADPRLAETRVIVSTGEPERTRSLDIQADLILVKPVSLSQISAFANRLRFGTGRLSLKAPGEPEA